MSTSFSQDRWSAILNDPEINEIGGENNNEGVDYARYWAMALLVEMETKKTPDYVLLFEYLQDVAVLDKAAMPTTATLYQVKKKSKGNWSKSALTKKESLKKADEIPVEDAVAPKLQTNKKLAGRSPLGKLHLCVERLSSIASVHGVFVSNAGYDLNDALGVPIPSNSRCSLSALHADDLEYVKSRLVKELKGSSVAHLTALSLEQSIVSPSSMRETVRGLIDELLSSKYPTLPSVSGRIQENLLELFSAGSGPKTGQTLSELIDKKGFTRDAFCELIEKYAKTKPFATALDTVIGSLKIEGMQPRAADKLHVEANRLQIQMVNSPQTKEVVCWDAALSSAEHNSSIAEYRELLGVVQDSIGAELKNRGDALPSITVLATALLAVIYVDQQS